MKKKKKVLSVISFLIVLLLLKSCLGSEQNQISDNKTTNKSTEILNDVSNNIVETLTSNEVPLSDNVIPLTKEEKVDNLMVLVDSWNQKYTSIKFREEIANYLELPDYDKKVFESYDFGYNSTVVWGLKDENKILIMSNFDITVYENFNFIDDEEKYNKVKKIDRYLEDMILYDVYNYEAYAIQDINTGEVILISQDDYTNQLQEKDENFKILY